MKKVLLILLVIFLGSCKPERMKTWEDAKPWEITDKGKLLTWEIERRDGQLDTLKSINAKLEEKCLVFKVDDSTKVVYNKKDILKIKLLNE